MGTSPLRIVADGGGGGDGGGGEEGSKKEEEEGRGDKERGLSGSVCTKPHVGSTDLMVDISVELICAAPGMLGWLYGLMAEMPPSSTAW